MTPMDDAEELTPPDGLLLVLDEKLAIAAAAVGMGLLTPDEWSSHDFAQLHNRAEAVKAERIFKK
jgi:hypothetical protein